jgi:hypothetical protein
MAVGVAASAQQLVQWKLLETTRYEYTERPERFDFAGKPIFSPEVKALDSRKIRIKGYLVPLDVGGWAWALSAYPFSSCFFCGGAGKESVISLQFDKKQRFDTDEVQEFVGILHLHSDPDGLTYVLEVTGD